MQLTNSLRLFQILVLLGIVTFLFWWLAHFSFEVPLVIPHSNRHEVLPTPLRPSPVEPVHPIDSLIRDSADQWDELLQKETKSLKAAAEAYRARRGRHPPPRFDEWYRFAQERNALFIEDFFDRIYDDLNPFWAIKADTLRWQASTYVQRISVRNGKAKLITDGDWMRTTVFETFISSIAKHLPDVDIAINVMDESRIVVPWTTLSEYLDIERQGRHIADPSQVINEYSSGWFFDTRDGKAFDKEWIKKGSHWSLARQGCNPNSPAARKSDTKLNLTEPPPLPNTKPPFSTAGYVGNWTIAKNICVRPELHALHGAFVEPVSFSTTQHLLPLFGECKLSVNNEILLPAAMYWSDSKQYSGGPEHGGSWEKKRDEVVWRGVASGGRNKKENWKFLHRHRFVSMMNGTSILAAEKSPFAAAAASTAPATIAPNPPNFKLPLLGQYDLQIPPPQQQNGKDKGQRTETSDNNTSLLGKWIGSITNIAFNKLLCFPKEVEDDSRCSYVDPYFSVRPKIPMTEQYGYKFLPDIDGNTFSGRYRSFLLSTSLPIKATIYDEWHDSRLVPWQHFVPMDNTFIDIYGILDYFIGYYSDVSGEEKDNEDDDDGVRARARAHDENAKMIAQNGKAWAERVLRKEDMQIYMYRLLLEYARVCDDDRDNLGFVGDLI